MDSIFLSASAPIPGREYYDSCSPFQIHTAVRTFLTLALGRRHIVFGGHPSITPMVYAACKNFGMEHNNCVTIYQSSFFKDEFPIENQSFADIRLVPAEATVGESVEAMRLKMLTEWNFSAGVFIGGMGGILKEHKTFIEYHPMAVIVPVRAPGGASADIPTDSKQHANIIELERSRDYLSIFVDRLGIMPSEPRAAVIEN